MLALLLACAGSKGPLDSASPATAVADAGPDLSALVGETLTLDGGGSEGEHFAWDFGDGQTAEGAVVEHAWDSPGTYAAVLTVTGQDGGWRSDTAVVTVTAEATDTPPVWSRTLTLAGGRLWVVNPEADSVGVIDLESRGLLELATCAGPRTLATDGQTVAVACERGDALQLIDARALTVEAELALPAGSRPYGVAGRDGAWWVSLQGLGSLVRTDGQTLETVEVGPDPRGVALLADGRVVATRWRSAEDGARLYVIEDGEVEVWTLAVDTRGDSDTTTGGVPNLLEEVVPTADGSTLVLPFSHANINRGAYRSGLALDHQSTLRAVVGFVDAATGEEDLSARKQLDESGRALAVAPSERGDRYYVLDPGVGRITALDAVTHEIVGTILDAGTHPTGLLADGDTLYVHAWLDRVVRAYDVSDLSVAPEPLWEAATLSEEPLSDEVLLGKQIFHDASDTRMSRSGYIACAHCHPDGRDDGLVWDFTDRGEGLRNTTSLEGRAGTGMGPLHWTGNFDEVQDFENDMRGAFGGSGFLSDEDWAECSETLGASKAGRSAELDALAAYVASLDETPPSPFEAPEGGEEAFQAAGCAECHPAPLYTDSTAGLRHDVGTITEASGGRLGGVLDGLDTPTMLGSWATAPYLHDGSAADLEAAIAAHDGASGLDAETLTLIASYIRSL